MNAKTKFFKVFRLMPAQMRFGIAYDWVNQPMSMNVVALEIQCDTKLGKKILKDLGFEND